VVVTNTGTATLTISGITITGTNAGDYSKATTCGGTLSASASCTVSVTFQPTGAGTRTATLNIADNAAGSPQAVSLSGTAIIGPVVAPAPSVSGD
jgi:hypothetical protein